MFEDHVQCKKCVQKCNKGIGQYSSIRVIPNSKENLRIDKSVPFMIICPWAYFRPCFFWNYATSSIPYFRGKRLTIISSRRNYLTTTQICQRLAAHFRLLGTYLCNTLLHYMIFIHLLLLWKSFHVINNVLHSF